MKIDIREEIEIPEGFNVELTDDSVRIMKDGKTSEKKVYFPVKKEGNKLVVIKEKATKRDKRIIKTWIAHIKSDIGGLRKRYVYRMQICSVHFPMNVSVKGQEIMIKNFLGEVKERKAKIINDVDVKVEKEFVIVESFDKEKAGQTAANIENATRVRSRDRRVFQDGIFIIEKEKGVRK